MKPDVLTLSRLNNQRLCRQDFASAADVVRWFGAIQAQDFYGSLWSIGQRMVSTTEVQVEKAIEDRSIIRTWPMRGTLHFVSPQDVYWMLPLLTPRIIQKAQTNYRKYGLDQKTFEKSRKLLAKALRDNVRLTRAEVYDVLEKGKVSTGAERGLHIINNSAMGGLLCFGPRQGKQQTFVLMEEWVPKKTLLSKEESLATLATRYFTGHGPATIQDFSWWSGLTLTEVKLSIDLAGKTLVKEKFGNINAYHTMTEIDTTLSGHVANLLSWYDEYIIGYKDRTAALNPATAKYITVPKNGIYSPMILLNGKISGTWRHNNDVETSPFRKLTSAETKSVNEAIKRYTSFISQRN